MAKLEELPADQRYASPDWAGGAPDLFCPLCEYNLRGLTEPRCPECGFKFAWHDLTDPARQRHPYLFEHHPERCVWSFWRTAVGGLRPAKFWTSLSPTQPPRPRRLLLYWVLAMGVALAGALSPYFVAWVQAKSEPEYTSFVPGVGAVPPRTELRRAWESVGSGYLGWLAWGLVWPWLTLLVLMIFQPSLRRAKVKPYHVRRCVLYSSDLLIWTGLCLTGLSAMSMVPTIAPRYVVNLVVQPITIPVLAGSAALIVWRLATACQLYLRFRRAWGIVIASQVIVALAAANVLACLWYVNSLY